MPDPKDTSKTQRLKKILWESTLNAPIRGAYNLMNTSYEDLVGGDAETTERIAGDSLSAAGGVTAGSAFVPKPRGAITMGANRRGGGGAPRPAKNAGGKAGGTSAPSGSSAAPQAGRASGGTSAPVGARSTAQAGRNSGGTSAPGGSAGRPQAGRKSGGTSAPGSSTRRPRPGEKKFIGPQNKPAPGDKKFIGPLEKPKPGDKNFIGPKNKPAPGDKDFIGPTKSAAQKPPRRTFGGKMKAGAAAGAGLLGYAAYRAADKPKASQGGAPSVAPTKTDRQSKADAFRAKQQGMKTPGSPTNPSSGTKKAGDKSRLAKKPEKKMTSFERMKQRQYEKEGYGGRSMTSKSAKERVKKERGFKFRDLFKKT